MIRYTRHARNRMSERKVTTAQVLETVESPDEIAVGDESESIAIRNFGTHEVRVIYREIDADTALVVTVIKVRRAASG
jgi:hypothetical protein